MKVYADNPSIFYMGRLDKKNGTEPLFIYAGSQAAISFRGTSVSVGIKNYVYWGQVSLGYVLDGTVGKIMLDKNDNGKDIILTIAENMEDTEHSLIVYKKSAGNQLFYFKGFEINGELLPPPALPELKLEVFGDSVCAGEVCEAVEYTAKLDPDGHDCAYDNVWYSFVMQTARNLNAQINNCSQGGIALFDGTGYYHGPETIGLESTYDKLCYMPEGGITDWDFSSYIPDVVVIAIGQNDKHNSITEADDISISEPSYRLKWKERYKFIVRELDRHYNGAKFVLTTTLLFHDKDWDNAIEEIKNELAADGIKVFHNVFKRNGAGTPGHPRIPEHNEMAEELTEFIRNIL